MNDGHILARVATDEFVGRAEAMDQVLRLASRDTQSRGLLILAAPAVGVSELLRQAYDKLFGKHQETIPIYFALARNDKTAVGAARHFLYTFLLQVTAFRRREPSLSGAQLTKSDLLELAAPADYEWMERLIEAVKREHEGGDERSLIRLCLSAPQRAAQHGAHTFVMLDGLHVARHLKGEVALDTEFAQMLMRSPARYVLASLRRHLLDVVHNAQNGFDGAEQLRLDALDNESARKLIENTARHRGVPVNEQTRDLIVQQFRGNSYFINALLLAAHERGVELTSFLNCQQLYVDELMGGRINRHFTSLLETIAPLAGIRRTLVHMLYESALSDNGKSSIESWRKRLGLESDQIQSVVRGLHEYELASVNANFIETGDISSSVWGDYLHTRYRMEVAADPRALVVADTLVETLKRAPQTMARHYRRAAALGLRELLARFNCQRVPASLLNYDRFARAYKGVDPEEILISLDAETDLIRLPQVVHVASADAFYPPAQLNCDEERCAIAHGFDAGNYTDANEVVWIAAEIDSKLEAGQGITEMWCDRLAQFARACGFTRTRLWLVAPEGFSSEASELLAEREAYGSSRQQLELITARFNADPRVAGKAVEEKSDEFELAIPMGEDTELIAAHTVEQIARRIAFQPEAINQIKTALVEACINATEHSLSPDRKIYQRFRVESDRLVVTVSSRGVVPVNFNVQGGEKGSPNNGRNGAPDQSKERRGWGLKLIRTLMDEVEFERVDDGTRLRMTKYLRKP